MVAQPETAAKAFIGLRAPNPQFVLEVQMKTCQEPTNTLYHHGININDSGFDLEDSFCHRLNKIRGIADLFFCMKTGPGADRQVTAEGAFGIHNTLMDAAEELRVICYKMLENQEVAR